MPAKEEFEELLRYCSPTWTVRDGAAGIQLTSRENLRNIFFSACGSHYPNHFNQCSSYWSSSLVGRNITTTDEYAWIFQLSEFDLSDLEIKPTGRLSIAKRNIGLPIRSVINV